MKRTPMPPRRAPLPRGKGFTPKHPCGAVLPLLLPSDTDDLSRVCTCGSQGWGSDIPAVKPNGAAKQWKPRKPIAPVSKKRAAENRKRRILLAEIAEEHPECAARLPGCTAWAQDGHEVLTRARGGSITDKANVIGVCRSCHLELTTPKDAEQVHELGLVRHSWDGPPPSSAGAA